MATTRMVKTVIWEDDWFFKLSKAAKLIYIYLITNKNTEISGMYRLPLVEMSVYLDMESKAIEKVIVKELTPKVAYADGWVIIPKYPEHQNVANNAKVQTSIEKYLEKVPAHILQVKSEIINHKSVAMDSSSIGYQNVENKGENGENTNSGKPVDNIKTASNPYDDDNFDIFWGHYPKKIGKGAAWSAWKKIKPNKTLAQQIISTLEHYKNTDQWKKESGQFIPHPATFLNQRRFDDSPDTQDITSQDKYANI